MTPQGLEKYKSAFKNSLPVSAVQVQLLPLAWPIYVLLFALVGLEAALSLTQLHLPAESPYPEMNRNATSSLMFKQYCNVPQGTAKKAASTILLQRKMNIRNK